MANSVHYARATPDAKRLRKEAGAWLKQLRRAAGLSQVELASRLGLRYYTFVSQIENGLGRVPSESMEQWALCLGLEPSGFAKALLAYYDPVMYRLLFRSDSP